MKKNFAGAPNGISLFPERGGQMATLTGLDLTTEVAPGQIFKKAPNFIDNCKSCNSNSMKNANGDSMSDYSGYQYNNTSNPNAGYYGGGSGSGSGSGGGGGLGSFLSGVNLGDLLKIGSTIYSNEQQIKLAQQQGQITAAQAAQAKAQLAIAQQKTQQDLSIKDRIKAYALPIAIGGGVIILGIATYFFFKRSKKVSQ
jgi:hypothetical protein